MNDSLRQQCQLKYFDINLLDLIRMSFLETVATLLGDAQGTVNREEVRSDDTYILTEIHEILMWFEAGFKGNWELVLMTNRYSMYIVDPRLKRLTCNTAPPTNAEIPITPHYTNLHTLLGDVDIAKTFKCIRDEISLKIEVNDFPMLRVQDVLKEEDVSGIVDSFFMTLL